MKYKTVTYQKVVNLGNYESHRLEITVEVDTESDDALYDAMTELSVTVHDTLVRFKEMHEYSQSSPKERKRLTAEAETESLPW